MKHLIVFGLIILGVMALTFLTKAETFSNADDPQSNNNQVYRINDIHVKKSQVGGKYGRGVFADRNFKAGEIIELCPYIEDKIDKFQGTVRDYVFSKDSEQKIAVVAFGYASLYNHSDEPNAKWEVTDDHVKISATKDINKDKEILVSYGDVYWDSRNDLEKK